MDFSGGVVSFSSLRRMWEGRQRVSIRDLNEVKMKIEKGMRTKVRFVSPTGEFRGAWLAGRSLKVKQLYGHEKLLVTLCKVS